MRASGDASVFVFMSSLLESHAMPGFSPSIRELCDEPRDSRRGCDVVSAAVYQFGAGIVDDAERYVKRLDNQHPIG